MEFSFSPSQHPALITKDFQYITYATLMERADRIAKHISARSLVFHLCQNTVDAIAGYLGILKADGVQLLLGERIDSALFSNLVSVYQPKYVFLPKGISNLEIDGSEEFSSDSHRLVKLNSAASYSVHDTLSLLLTTSGSTGSPKLVRLTQKNIKSNAESIAEYLQIDQRERPITSLPMNYSFGLSVINSHLARGASLVLSQASLTEAEFWKSIKEANVTSLSGVPYAFEILKKFRFEKMDLPHLKTLAQAGGKLSDQLMVDFAEDSHEKSRKFFVMYGQTEATARMSYLPWEFARTKIGSIGIPIPGGKFTIEEDGELVYHGANVSLGYAESFHDLALGDINQGVLKTGDIARKDADGHYEILGRKTRFLKIFGSRISLSEVESLVTKIGFECACSGRDDLLEVYITDMAGVSSIEKSLSLCMGIHPSAIKVQVIAKIPRNDFGKVIYAELGGA